MRKYKKILILIFCLWNLNACNSSENKIVIDKKTCYRSKSKINTAKRTIPIVTIQDGDFEVFDYERYKENPKKADSDFYERLTFQISNTIDSFFIKDQDLLTTDGIYEFHGGMKALANTDFRIKIGFIKGKKVGSDWLIEVSVGVVDKQKTDSVIQKISFSEIFKRCN